MKFLLSLSWLLLPILSANAETIAQTCAESCFDAVSILNFSDIDPTAFYYTGLCNSTLFVTSMYACFDVYCSKYSSAGAWDSQAQECREYGGITLPDYDSTIATLNVSAIPVIDVAAAAYVETINNTVIPDAGYFGLSDQTLTVWNYEVHMHHVYGWSMYVLAAFVISIGVANRLFVFFFTKTFKSDIEGKTGTKSRFPFINKVNNLVHKHILLPATFGYQHVQPWGWCTIPTRLQSILVFIYIALNFIFSCVDYQLFIGNTYWSSTKYQLARYIADRTGIMSFANLPLLFLFAGRNNLLLWITGWSFATFNIMHRCVARIATLQAIVHSIAYTYCCYLDTSNWSEYNSYWEQQWFYCGAVATIAMSLISGFSILPIRQKAYELFLAFHVSFSIVGMVTLFYHVKIFTGEYDPYLWTCVGFWAFDRLIRFVRLVFLNWRLASNKGSRATVSYDAESEILRLMVRPSARFMVGPGLHYYIHTPTLSFKFWENHPFTLASWGVSNDGADTPSSTSSNEKNTTFVRAVETETFREVQQLEFIIRPYKGMTSALKNSLVKNSSRNIPILIEGPYGTPVSLDHYERILLISGGSGVTATLAYLTKYSEHHVRFVCIVRQERFLNSLVNKELSPFMNKENVHMDLHSTDKQVLGEYALGRPNLANIIGEEIANLSGRLAVVVCGPAKMNDDVRREVVRVIGNGIDASRISLYEEAFGW